MTTMPVSVELDTATIDRLAERERETGQSRSQLAQQYIEEGLRMERHPGIVFRDGPTGRRAALIGGPDVWEVIPEIYDVDVSDDAQLEAASASSALPSFRIKAALAYYAEYRDEIDAWIERNNTLADRLRAEWHAAQASVSE